MIIFSTKINVPIDEKLKIQNNKIPQQLIKIKKYNYRIGKWIRIKILFINLKNILLFFNFYKIKKIILIK